MYWEKQLFTARKNNHGTTPLIVHNNNFVLFNKIKWNSTYRTVKLTEHKLTCNYEKHTEYIIM
jgi:hypothetical protein